MPILLPKFMATALTLTLWAGTACADQIHVPSQYPTIQEAIDAAVDGDEIVIAAGTYRELLDGQNKSLTYTGAGMGETILSGDLDEDGVPDGACLTINSTDVTQFPSVVVRGLALTNSTMGLTARRIETCQIIECQISGASEIGVNAEKVQTTLDIIDSLASSNEVCVWISGSTTGLRELRVNGCRFETSTRGLISNLATEITDSEFVGHQATALQANLVNWSVLISGSVFRDNTSTAVNLIGNPGFESTSTILNCVFEDNRGIRPNDIAGALRFSGVGQVDIANCEFRRNISPDAGAVWGFGSSSIVGCIFEENGCDTNSNPELCSQSTVRLLGTHNLSGCAFRKNIGLSGAGVYILPSESAVSRLEQCEFWRNESRPAEGETQSGRGGAIYSQGALVEIDGCIFKENRARDGGALYESSGGSAKVLNSQFLANMAVGVGARGGAISTQFRPLITGSVFVGNSAPLGMSGAVHGNYAPTFESSVFVDNSAASGDVCDTTRSVYDIRNSIVLARGKGVTFVNSQAGLLDVPIREESLVTTNHQIVRLVRLPNDGGDGWGNDPATQGVDESMNDDFGDLRLLAGSPAIDAGNNTIVRSSTSIYTYDLDGNPRFVDAIGMPNLYPGTSVGGPIDLGPYEFQGVSCWADVNTDGVLSPADFTAWIAVYNAHAPRADQNRDGGLNPADFTAWIANFNAGCN